MKENFTSLEELPVLINANQLSNVLGISKASAYTLMRSESFPTLRIGKRMLVVKEKLIIWINENSVC